jgi:hypothetical protein
MTNYSLGTCRNALLPVSIAQVRLLVQVLAKRLTNGRAMLGINIFTILIGNIVRLYLTHVYLYRQQINAESLLSRP